LAILYIIMPNHLILIYIGSVILSSIIGIFVILQDRKSLSNITFFGFTFFQVLWTLSLYFGFLYAIGDTSQLELSDFFVKTAYGNGLLALLMLNMFFYYFPRKSIKIGRIKIYAYLSFNIILAILAYSTNYIHNEQIIVNGHYTSDTFGVLYIPYLIMMLTALLLSVFLATKKAIKLKGLEKLKIKYALIGGWLFVVTAIMTNIILPIFGIYTIGSVSLIQISPAYGLFFILPTFYSVYKHRFFNFSYLSFSLLRRLLFYSIFLLTAYVFYQFLDFFFSGINLLFLCALGALTSLITVEILNKYIPEFISENLRTFRNTIRELKTIIYSCDTLEKLQYALEQAFLIDHDFVNAKLYIVRQGEENLDIYVYPKNNFTKILSKYRKNTLVADEVKYLKLDKKIKTVIRSNMKKLYADICIPLFSENNLIGFFIIKRKGINNTFSKEEIDEITNIKRGLEIALMNILLKLNLEEENNLMRSIIEEKTRELNIKIKNNNELLMQQSDFIAVTAHEFRTPLSIALFQLEDIMSSDNCIKIKNKLATIDSSLINLKTLTEKLFAVQQYDLNKVKLQLKKIDISSFIKNIFDDFKPIMKKKYLKFNLKIPKKKLNAKVDITQLRQVLYNLLNNASKFTHKNGQVVLSLEEYKGKILIQVNDSGNGIPDNLKKSIFGKFRTKSAGSGIGLGLYLCRKIIELHNGNIWIEDSDLGGASFCVQLKKLRT